MAGKFKPFCEWLAQNKVFELVITGIILLNSVLIGVETYHTSETISLIQQIILYIFTFEIIVRFIAAKDVKSFFQDGWNVFDLTLVLIGYVPETLVANGSIPVENTKLYSRVKEEMIPAKINLIPYFAFANNGESDMEVFLYY